jgi:hypothetical protein
MAMVLFADIPQRIIPNVKHYTHDIHGVDDFTDESDGDDLQSHHDHQCNVIDSILPLSDGWSELGEQRATNFAKILHWLETIA